MILHIYYHDTKPSVCNFFIVDKNSKVIGGSREHFLGQEIGENNQNFDLSLMSTMKFYDERYNDNTYPNGFEKKMCEEDYMKNKKEYIKKLISPRKTIGGFYFINI